VKTWETPRGRPVGIDAVPDFCPLCGYAVGRERFRMHALEEHPDRCGWLVKYVRGMPATKIGAMLIEQAAGIRIYVVLLDSPTGGVPTMKAEIFPAYVEERGASQGGKQGYRFETAIASHV
jgi:hypothetical protein